MEKNRGFQAKTYMLIPVFRVRIRHTIVELGAMVGVNCHYNNDIEADI